MDPDPNPDTHQIESWDPDLDSHQTEKLDSDPDPQFADDKPKCMEYEPI